MPINEQSMDYHLLLIVNNIVLRKHEFVKSYVPVNSLGYKDIYELEKCLKLQHPSYVAFERCFYILLEKK